MKSRSPQLSSSFLSSEVEYKVAHLLATIARMEREIDVSRNVLNDLSDFTPHEITRAISRESTTLVDEIDLCAFLNKHHVQVTTA